LLAAVTSTPKLIAMSIDMSAIKVVGNRPDRIEPRVNKRRSKAIALLNKPRRRAIQEIKQAACRKPLHLRRQCHSLLAPFIWLQQNA